MYTNQFSDIKSFAKGIKRGTFGMYAATLTEKKMNKFPNGTTPAMRKVTPENPYVGRVLNLTIYQNAATGLNYYNIVKSECEREGIHFTDAEFTIAFPKEETYCEATEDALANIILKHNDREQEYLRLYKGRKPTKVAYFTICDDEIVEEGSELMNDILRYVPKSGGSAKQEALGIRNIVEVKQPKIENVILLAQSDNIFINPDFEGLANHIMENLENIFKKK